MLFSKFPAPAAIAATLMSLLACAPEATLRPLGPPDAPVPANAARAKLELLMDLVPSASCEQQFDLALYETRSIVLIEWQESTPRCTQRHASITYLSRELSADGVQKLAAQHARVRETKSR